LHPSETSAEAYTAPVVDKLVESKGVIHLAAYVMKYADPRKIKGKGHARDNALAALASAVTDKHWGTKNLREKVRSFEKDYRGLYKLLMRKLDDLHRYHSAR